MTVPRYTPIRRAHSCFPSSSQRFVYQAPGSSAEPGTGYVPACGRAGEVIGGPGAVVRSYPFHRPGLLREVADEPVPGQPGGRGEGARLLEQVGGAGHHSQVVLAPQLRLGPAVEVQHHLVMPADDEQCRSGHGREPGAGKIGAAAAGTTAAVPAPGSAAAHSAAAPIRTLAGTPSARAEASCPRPFPPGLLQPPRGPADPRQHRRSRRAVWICSLTGGPAQRAGSPARAASGLSARGSGTALPAPSACLPGVRGVFSSARVARRP